jgi:hypothetical protein
MRNVLHQFADKKLSPHAVMRAAVAYDQWLVPAMYMGQTLGRTQLNKLVSFGTDFSFPAGTLWLFTDLESGTLASEKGARLGPYEGGVRGAEIFARIPASLTEIVVNHGSPDRDKLYLRAPSFGNVGVWVDVMSFEAKLAGPTTPAMVEAVKQYDAYFIAQNADGSLLTLANIDGLRNLLVLFTGPDSMQELLAKLGPAAATMRTGQTTGPRLMGALASMGIDGVVVNPVGPGARRVFKLAELTR